MLRFDVYGRKVGVVREEGGWSAVFLGESGKHRPAPGVIIPPWVTEDELVRYLADLFHEGASPERPEVVRLPDTNTEGDGGGSCPS